MATKSITTEWFCNHPCDVSSVIVIFYSPDHIDGSFLGDKNLETIAHKHWLCAVSFNQCFDIWLSISKEMKKAHANLTNVTLLCRRS
jgi:hypothetical protein